MSCDPHKFLFRSIFAFCLAVSLCFLTNEAWADQSNNTVIVTVTVPGAAGAPNTGGSPGGGGGGGGGDRGGTPACTGSNCPGAPAAELDVTPPAIRDVSAIAARTTAEIRWAAADRFGVTECVLSYSRQVPGSASTRLVLPAAPDITYRALLSELVPKSAYAFRITCFDAARNGADAEGWFQTLPVETVPADVTGLSPIPSDRVITLLWQYPATVSDVRSFVIRRKQGSAPKNINDGELVAEITDPAAREYIDAGLENDQQYFYTIFVLNTSGKNSAGRSASARPGRAATARPDTLVGAAFWIAHGSLPVTLNEGKLYSLTGDTVIIALPEAHAPLGVERVVLMAGKNRYQLRFDAANRGYQAAVPMPPPGSAPAMLLAYVGDFPHVLSFTLVSYPYGSIRGSEGQLFGGVRVRVSLPDGSPFDTTRYQQTNPMVTNNEGGYGFVLPNGTYAVSVEKSGFRGVMRSVTVTRHVLNEIITLVPTTPLEAFIYQVPEWLNQIWQYSAGLALTGWRAVEGALRQFIHHPLVKQLAERVVAPIAALIMVAATLPSLAHLLYPLARHLFFAPLPLMTKRKREGGVVYDSRTKLPVGLAHIRLIDAKTGAYAQTEVTDLHGRYLLLPVAGQYRIVVYKPGYVFPTRALTLAATDGSRGNLYHGETRAVSEDGQSLAPNIPVDPDSAPAEPGHAAWREEMRRMQNGICLFNITLGAAACIIVPSLRSLGLLAVQLIAYGLFMKFLKPRLPGWGMVLDQLTGRPIRHAAVRLWNANNMLVATQKTHRHGRYGFPVGPNQYYVTIDHPLYEPTRSGAIAIKEGDARPGKQNIRLSPRRPSES